MKIVFHAWAYGRFIEIQSNLRRKKIPWSGCARKETFHMNIFVTSGNGDRKIKQ